MKCAHGKAWNRLLVFAVLVLFALNMWLVRSLNNVKSDVQMLEETGGLRHSQKKQQPPEKQMQEPKPPNPKPQLCSNPPQINKNEAILLGHRKYSKDFLTIAIPTVRRGEKSYLSQTLDSLIKNTNTEDRAKITVVIFSANLDPKLNMEVKADLESKYLEHFNSGFMQVITAAAYFYPPLTNLKQNFGDSKERVLWRAKQVVDYAYLFSYCQDLSEYYLQLEDDVVSAPDFVQTIQDFLKSVKGKQWTVLEFSELGFIGKLFRSSELSRMAQFMLFFYEDQPVDYLLSYYTSLNAQEGRYLNVPSIFQHIGLKSSLQNKQQELLDRFFEESARQYQSDNPPAMLYSSMEVFGMCTPQLAYRSKPGYFWGKTPITGEMFLIVFKSPPRLSRVIILTGSKSHPDDFLRSGKLEASPAVSFLSRDSTPRCADYRFIGEFANGRIDVSNLEETLDFKCHCLQITITKSQPQWLLIREVAVWVVHVDDNLKWQFSPTKFS